MSGMEDHHHDRAKVMEAFGGTRGLIDSGVPSILFLVAFNLTHNLNTAVISSLALSAVLTRLGKVLSHGQQVRRRQVCDRI